MIFSEDEFQLLIKKVEEGQAKARRRTVVAIIIPTITATLYLGFTIWLISIKQSELKRIEVDLNNRNQELSRAETTLARKNEEIRQVQRKIAQGNIVAAQKQIVSISTDLVWRSETNKTRLPDLDRVCFGQFLLENIETVFGYNNLPFSGTIYVQSPKQSGCVPGDILRGRFNLTGNAGNCIGDIVIIWKNMNRSHIKWTISNLGTSCPVGTKNWEIPVYPVQK